MNIIFCYKIIAKNGKSCDFYEQLLRLALIISFYNTFQEYLAGTKKKEKKDMSYKCKWYSIRVIFNLIVLCMIGGSGYLIFYILEQELSSVSNGGSGYLIY